VLTATLEQLKQTCLATKVLEDVLFVHLDHRQSAMLGVHMVTIFLVSAFRQQEALFARRTTLLAIQLSDAL